MVSEGEGLCPQSLVHDTLKLHKFALHSSQNEHFFKEKNYSLYLSQRWSQGHKARGQGHKKNSRPRPRTAFPRTDTLEAKDRNARGQGQGPRTQAQVLSKKNKKWSSQKFFRQSTQKNFQAPHKILTIQKIVLSSGQGQSNFRGLEASRARLRT